MIVDDNNFFNFSTKKGNIFSTNVKSILGRNIILNYIQGMDFELKMFNFSETANDIAEFYEKIKAKGDVSKFFKNDVIKLILEEIQDMPTLKEYLYRRIFNLIEQDKVDMLQKIYDNNETLSTKVEAEEDKFINEQRKYKEEIKKIMSDKGISEENAKILYENMKLKEKLKEQMQQGGLRLPVPVADDLMDKLLNISSFGDISFGDIDDILPTDDIFTSQPKLQGKDIGDKPQIPENQDIYITDNTDDDFDDFDEENFWD